MFYIQCNVRTADVLVMNKIDTADHADIAQLRDNVRNMCKSDAILVDAASPITLEGGDKSVQMVRNKDVLVVEDGPTLTHGGMKYGAGMVAAQRVGPKSIIDPKVRFHYLKLSALFQR